MFFVMKVRVAGFPKKNGDESRMIKADGEDVRECTGLSINHSQPQLEHIISRISFIPIPVLRCVSIYLYARNVFEGLQVLTLSMEEAVGWSQPPADQNQPCEGFR